MININDENKLNNLVKDMEKEILDDMKCVKTYCIITLIICTILVVTTFFMCSHVLSISNNVEVMMGETISNDH